MLYAIISVNPDGSTEVETFQNRQDALRVAQGYSDRATTAFGPTQLGSTEALGELVKEVRDFYTDRRLS